MCLIKKGFQAGRFLRKLGFRAIPSGFIWNDSRSSTLTFEQLLQLDDDAFSAIAYASSQQLTCDTEKEYFISRISYFLNELKRTDVTRNILWQESKKEQSNGYSYSQFCDLLSQHRKKHEASMHFEHNPAEVLMVDFAGDSLSYVDQASGEIIKCPVFVAVLPYSGYSFAVALSDSRQPNVVKALNCCLTYFGGVLQSIKCDNMKTALSKSSRYEPVFTEVITHWALYNNTALLAARVRKLKIKHR